MKINEEEIKEEKTGKRKKKTAMELALAYLANRMRTDTEMRDYLHKKDCTDGEISEVIQELKDLKYLDDYYYALRYLEYNHCKRRGCLRAMRELEQKGVNSETVKNAYEDYIYENKIDEYGEVLELAREEVFYESEDGTGRIIKRETDDRLVAKIGRKLERKGFCAEHIYKAINEIKNTRDDSV